MPHSYGASLADVGRRGPSNFDAANDSDAKRNTRMIIVRMGRYSLTPFSHPSGRKIPHGNGTPPFQAQAIRTVHAMSLPAFRTHTRDSLWCVRARSGRIAK